MDGGFEYLKTLAVSRLYLDNVRHVQGSWVTQGSKIGQVSLSFGADDLGSIMIEENVVYAAGARNRMTQDEMRRIIADAGYTPVQRRTLYAHALGAGDFRTALAILQDEAKLEALYPVEEHKVKFKGAPLVLTIVEQVIGREARPPAELDNITEEVVTAHDSAQPTPAANDPPAPGPADVPPQ